MIVSSEHSVKTIIIDEPTKEQVRMIIELYLTQGWMETVDDKSTQLTSRLITGSHCFVVAMIEDNVVGMGRAISDGVSDAYIQDLTVREEYRKQGIARRILQTILGKLHSDGLQWIGLIAEPGSIGLYHHAGFRQMPAWIPMLMKRNI
jgi:spermidine synthase